MSLATITSPRLSCADSRARGARRVPSTRPDHFGTHSIPELRAGGVNVQVLPIWVTPEDAEAALRNAVLTAEYLHEEAEKNADAVAICGDGAAIDAAVAAGKIALVLALEGCAPIGQDSALFRTFFRLGVRIASFTHMGRTLLADGSGEDDTGSRLPGAGVAAVREMERLGILVDVSHLSIAGTAHVLEIAARPVIASHSSARALHDIHRNLSDDQLRAIAATGGVIGVNFLPVFLDARVFTLDRLVDHIAHIVGVVGEEHVGIGPDFIADYYDALYPTFSPPFHGFDLKVRLAGMTGPRDLPHLTEALLARGFGEDAVRKILGANFLRVFREVLGHPARG